MYFVSQRRRKNWKKYGCLWKAAQEEKDDGTKEDATQESCSSDYSLGYYVNPVYTLAIRATLITWVFRTSEHYFCLKFVFCFKSKTTYCFLLLK